MDIVIMIMITTLVFMIYKGYRPSFAISLWALTAVLTLVLLRIHMSSPLPLEF